MRCCCSQFDVDGAGELSYTEFITDVLGLQPNALQKNPGDSNARPSTPEILQKVTGQLKKQIMGNPDAIKKAFTMFDKSGDGTLSLDEYRMGIEALGLPITRPQIRKMFLKHSNGDIDGEIQTKVTPSISPIECCHSLISYGSCKGLELAHPVFVTCC